MKNEKPSLWPEHIRILADRAISEEYARRPDVNLTSIDLRDVIRFVDRHGKDKSPLPGITLYPTTGLVIPYPPSKDGIDRFRVRVDERDITVPGPVEGSRQGETTKRIPRYLAQRKPATVIPYITPGAFAVASDATKPIAIVEAPLKAMALDAHGIPAIGLGGVVAGAHDTEALADLGEIVAHKELRRIDLRGRTVRIIFDAGQAVKPLVALGVAMTAIAVMAEGAEAQIVTLPLATEHDNDPESGVVVYKHDQGPDDFIARNGIEALKALIDQAVPADPAARLREIIETTKGVARADAVSRLLAEFPVRALLYKHAPSRDHATAIIKSVHLPTGQVKHAISGFREALARDAKKNEPENKRPTIVLTTDEKAVNDAVIEALATHPDVYQRAGSLVTVVHELDPKSETTSPKIHPLSTASIRELITACVRLVRNTDTGEQPASPPKEMAAQIAARTVWPRSVRVLDRIVETPTMRRDGSILQTPGYDGATGLLYIPSIDFPSIPEAPTFEDARSARDRLADLLHDYQFERREHRAACLAGWMTTPLREAINGYTPVTLIDAAKPGIGKTMLADIASVLATGRKASRVTYAKSDEETHKTLTSVVLRADPLILIDNLAGSFGGPEWDAFVTAPSWQSRLLGGNSMIDAPVRTVVFATGNNVEPTGDIVRRTLHVRLVTDLEHPELRPPESFRHRDLLGYVQEHRAQLVVDIFTIVRAYIAAGRPKVDGGIWGSFEAWADLIAKPLIWLGEADPCITSQGLAASAANPKNARAELLAQWHEALGDQPHTAGEILRILDEERKKPSGEGDAAILTFADALGSLCFAEAGQLPSARSIGKRLAKIRDGVEGGRVLRQCGEREGSVLWRIEHVGAPGMSPPADDTPDMNEFLNSV